MMLVSQKLLGPVPLSCARHAATPKLLSFYPHSHSPSCAPTASSLPSPSPRACLEADNTRNNRLAVQPCAQSQDAAGSVGVSAHYGCSFRPRCCTRRALKSVNASSESVNASSGCPSHFRLTLLALFLLFVIPLLALVICVLLLHHLDTPKAAGGAAPGLCIVRQTCVGCVSALLLLLLLRTSSGAATARK